ncbi:MAG: hypothetical protein AB8F95_20630, partial [Bacteroidia bacterium]
FEEAQGKIYCEERVENNERRKEGEFTQHEEKRPDYAQLVEEAWKQSDNGASFKSAIEEQGLVVAAGNRRDYVLVADDGKVISIARQIKDVNAQAVRDRMADLERASLPDAKALVFEREHYDRDRYAYEQEEALIDAAIEAEEGREDEEEGEGDMRTLAPPSEPANVRQEFMDAGHEYFGAIDEYEARQIAKKAAKDKEVKPAFKRHGTQTESGGYKSVADEVDRQNALKAGPWRRRRQQEERTREYYRIDEQAKELAEQQAQLDDMGVFGKLTGKQKEQEDRIEALRKNLENARRRQAESMERIEAQYQGELSQAGIGEEPSQANEPEPESEYDARMLARMAERRGGEDRSPDL